MAQDKADVAKQQETTPKKKKSRPSIVRSTRKLLRRRTTKLGGLIIIGVLLGLGGGYLIWGGTGAGNQLATSNSSRGQQLPGNIQKIRQQQGEDRYKRAKQRVTDDVKSGKLSQQQADSINAKLDELHASLGKTDITTKEGREAYNKQRTALRDWAEQNHIPTYYVLIGF